MLKIYNSHHRFLALLDKGLKEVYTTDSLDTGWRTLCFQVPCNPDYINLLDEENYVETNDYNYIIKEVKSEDNFYLTVYCQPDIDDFKSSVHQYFDVSQKSVKQAYEYCLADTGWQLSYHSVDNTRLQDEYKDKNKYKIEMIRKIANDFNQEFWFDTKNKILYIYDNLGKDLGAFYSNELKLKLLKRFSNSYDYGTIVYPVPNDKMSGNIQAINEGRDYIENFDYTDKRIVKFYEDKDATHAEQLLKGAQEYLNEICVPKTTYEIALTDIGPSVSLGDNIIIVDKIKNTKIKQRVVEIVRYQLQPEKSKLIISNLPSNFYKMFVAGNRELEKDMRFVKNTLENDATLISNQATHINKIVQELKDKNIITINLE